MGTRVNPYIAERVKELTENGVSASEIAKQIHCTVRTVVRYRRRLGISQPHNGHHRMTEEDKARAEQMFEEGCSATEISRTLGFAPVTILKYFPGRQWSRQQCGEWSQYIRRVAS